MKKLIKKLAAFAMAAAMLLCIAPVERVEAASTAEMKKANVSWDLENGKTVTVHTKFAGISGLQNMTVKMSKYKVTKAKKEGYKKITFTLTYKYTFKPTSEQVHKIANSTYAEETDGSFGGKHYYAVVDYKTGIDLETDNDLGVTVKNGGWVRDDEYTYYYDDDECWVSLVKKITVKVTITYPEDYTGLCIGVGGYRTLDSSYTEADNDFWNGKTTFNKTSLYSKKDKKVAHFMRVK